MDTIHDLGGTEGFGPIPNQYDDDAVLFDEEWKARIWALAMMSMSKLSEQQTGWTLDWYRHVLERLPPNLYLQLDYFEKWILAMMVTSVDEGIAGVQELLDGHAKTTELHLAKKPPADSGDAVAARFAPGDRVMAKRDTGSMHTRLPAYVRRRGTVESVIGPQPLPDESAVGLIRREQTYVVRFAMAELWPEAANSSDALMIDMWDSYVEPA